MQKSQFFHIPIFLFCFILVILLSCEDSSKDNTLKNIQNQVSGSKNIDEIAEKIYSDPDFRFIEKVLVRRLKDGLKLTDSTSELRSQTITSLPTARNLSEKESLLFANALGFLDAQEFKTYMEENSKLLVKYSALTLTNEDANFLETALQNKCLAKESSVNKELLLLVENKLLKDPTARTTVRPECWKCVFDYLKCVKGYDTDQYTTNITQGYDQSPSAPSRSTYLIRWTSLPRTIVVVVTFVTYTGEIKIDQAVQVQSGDSCTSYYIGCLQSTCINI